MSQVPPNPNKAPVFRPPRKRLAWIGQAFLIILAVAFIYMLVRPRPDNTSAIQNPVLFSQFIISGLQLGFVYALIALGYTMVYGIVKLINFAHGDIFMVGAFIGYFEVGLFKLNTWPSKIFP